MPDPLAMTALRMPLKTVTAILMMLGCAYAAHAADATTASATSGSVTSGSVTPGSATSGSVTPGSVTPGSATPVATVTIDDVEIIRNARWDAGSEPTEYEGLGVTITSSVHGETPVLLLETRVEQVVDDRGVNLIPHDQPPEIPRLGRCWETYDGRFERRSAAGDPTILSTTTYHQRLDAHPGHLHLSGHLRIAVATSGPVVVTVPIDGPRRMVALADTHLAIEVGRHDGGEPSLGLPDDLLDHVAALALFGGTPMPEGNFHDIWAFALPRPTQHGDTMTLTMYPTIQEYDLPFAADPVDVTPLFSNTGPSATAPSSADEDPSAGDGTPDSGETSTTSATRAKDF